MTAQTPESLLVDGRPRPMCSEPLQDYFQLAGVDAKFEFTCTALWRGYIGHREMAHNRLWARVRHGQVLDAITVERMREPAG